MKNQFSLNIKTPCHEKFSTFSSTPNGGFCDSCEKEVIDFTAMSAQDIVTYFKNQKDQTTCGRFNALQLQTHNAKSQQRKRFSILSGIGLACLSLFTFNTAQAQELKIGTTENSSEIKASKLQKEIIVKGIVSDESGPLPAANVMLEGTSIGTTTDFDGNFEFPEKLKTGDILIFSYVGMDSQKIVIEDKDSVSEVNLKINMEMNDSILMGKVAVKGLYKSKRK